MFIRIPEAHGRSFMKALSWRIVGSVDTFVISFIVTGRLTFAVSISFIETFTKILIYYFHERFWDWVPWGRGKELAQPAADKASADHHAQAPAS
ncbi:MAG: DUF2061 domain-containing protein [Caulobacterales bacterium]